MSNGSRKTHEHVALPMKPPIIMNVHRVLVRKLCRFFNFSTSCGLGPDDGGGGGSDGSVGRVGGGSSAWVIGGLTVFSVESCRIWRGTVVGPVAGSEASWSRCCEESPFCFLCGSLRSSSWSTTDESLNPVSGSSTEWVAVSGESSDCGEDSPCWPPWADASLACFAAAF